MNLKDLFSRNTFSLLIESTFKAYSTVLFSNQKSIGVYIFLSTLFNYRAALTGFLGILLSNLLALFLGVHKDKIRKGLYGFNGLLVGLSISLYYEVDAKLLLVLFAAIVLLVFVTLSLEHVLSYFFGLPVLSVPFVIVSIIVYMAFFNYNAFTYAKVIVFPYDSYFPKLPVNLLFYIKSLGAIFFQSSPWAGLCIVLILLLFSRIAFILSLLGFYIGLWFHSFLFGSYSDISAGMVGFNYILSAIAVGGIFLVPSLHTFVLGALAAVVSSLIASFAKIFLVNFSIPVLALPFTLVSLMFLFVARLLRNPKLRAVDFLPGSPENNLDYFKTRKERFGESGIDIRLPFSGNWKVSQGYDGKYTHQDLWKESLDFMAIGPENSYRKGLADDLSDYYTYALPVLAPANGKVVKVVAHLPDNPVGEMDVEENWGNLVLIEHSPYLFSQLSHFKKDSILVKEGDQVVVGSKLGQAGNSGRSAEPHIHLHFQSNSEVGSTTLPVNFTQFLKLNRGTNQIVFNDVPAEDDTIGNVIADFNLKTFFTLNPGIEYSVNVSKKKAGDSQEIWKNGIDFLGNRYIEDSKANRLYFYQGRDFFACLDYNGSKNSFLFFFFLSVYRVPFYLQKGKWQDQMSYKYFSSFFSKLAKDLIHPFSDKVASVWSAEVRELDSQYVLSASVKMGNRILFESDLTFTSSLPGHMVIRDQNGDTWELSHS
ncbi:MAG: urea transporter [Spirochaetota bacterium]